MSAPNQSVGLQALYTALGWDDDEAAEVAVAQLTTADEAQLLQLLEDTDENRQWWAARALGACGAEASIQPLCILLENGTVELRAVAALAIGTLAQRLPKDLTQPLLHQLTASLADENGMIRQVTADALAQCGNAAIPALVEVLRFGEEQGARSRAAYALGKIGTMETASALYRCLNDPNYLVHTYAYEALDKLGLLETMLVQP